MKYYVKLICGYRKDQEYSISANEAHKAYYLFDHRDQFGTFDDGLAIKGSSIDAIVPDYNRTMGWNPTYLLTNDDHNALTLNGVKQKMQFIMSEAKEIASHNNQEELATPLNVLLKGKTPQLAKAYRGSTPMKELLAGRSRGVEN